MKKTYYPYEEFREDLKILTQKIDKPFDVILGIARGGLCMAQMLGEFYDLREVYAINTMGYDGTVKRGGIEVFNIPRLKLGQRVLIVDDIVDSGDTLLEVLAVLEEQYSQLSFMTASLFYKKSARIEPDYWVKEATEWIEFFWSEDLKEERIDV